MQPFNSPGELWGFLLKPGAIIHNPYDNVTLRLKDGHPQRRSRIKPDTWVPGQIPLYFKCWEKENGNV